VFYDEKKRWEFREAKKARIYQVERIFYSKEQHRYALHDTFAVVFI
jgi:hypothetical protein